MAQHLTISTIIFAIAGGFIPSLLWLWFWLKEDNKPEPRIVLIRVFTVGMLMVPVAIAIEYVTMSYIGLSGSFLLLAWAFAEEILKYMAAKKTALSTSYFDEPIDAVIYMMTAALGFASLENTLFIIKSLIGDNVLSGVNTGSMRFLGATLLHAMSSAVIGSFIAFSFRKNKKNLRRNTIIGIITAGFLHFIFNYFIIEMGSKNILKILMPLWFATIVLIFIFEKVRSNIK